MHRYVCERGQPDESSMNAKTGTHLDRFPFFNGGAMLFARDTEFLKSFSLDGEVWSSILHGDAVCNSAAPCLSCPMMHRVNTFSGRRRPAGPPWLECRCTVWSFVSWRLCFPSFPCNEPMNRRMTFVETLLQVGRAREPARIKMIESDPRSFA
jgi:hypothetical protein